MEIAKLFKNTINFLNRPYAKWRRFQYSFVFIQISQLASFVVRHSFESLTQEWG